MRRSDRTTEGPPALERGTRGDAALFSLEHPRLRVKVQPAGPVDKDAPEQVLLIVFGPGRQPVALPGRGRTRHPNR